MAGHLKVPVSPAAVMHMSTKPRDGTTPNELSCGRLGCNEPAIVILKHPRLGYEAVCELHTVNRWVIDYVR